MAASSKRHDYAHILLDFLKVKYNDSYIRNTYPFETDKNEYLNLISSIDKNVVFSDKTIVIVQFGDNVPNYSESLMNFEYSLDNILLYLKSKNSRFFCLSTWWINRPIDQLIKKRCEQHGGIYVFIGDIYVDPTNDDRSKVTYAHAGIEAHPKNWGMRKIALRISRAIYRSDIHSNL